MSKQHLWAIALWIFSGMLPAGLLGQEPAKPRDFLGGYADLAPEQKRLVDDWCQRFSQTIGKAVEPSQAYENLALSEKTTFNAVTHALLTTALTDQAEKGLGPAIQLIGKLDKISGKAANASADQQFRIYVQLKPGALELLSSSREFARTHDNTVFHKGYPICFRTKPATPSIQVSLSADARIADIDVDYRSSSFPVALVNGHLTASNSDVRSGNNDERHNQRWEGLPNWWRSLLGLPVAEESTALAEFGNVIPKLPKLTSKAKPEEVIRDFLSSWLVEYKPQDAMAYFDSEAYACMEVEQGKRVDRGMAPFVMLKAMQDVNSKLGKVTHLTQASAGMRLTGARARVIPQPYESEFVLYDVREDLAEQVKCSNTVTNFEQASAKDLQSKAFGKYVAAVFRLQSGKEKGETVATLWAKRDNYWKLITYDVEPEFDKLRSPDLRSTSTETMLERVEGDPQMIQAATEFMKDWFVRGRPEKALEHVSIKCYDCVNLYRPEDKPPPKNDEDARRMLLEGMRRVAGSAGNVKKLNLAIVAPSPHHPDLKLVKQGEEKSFVIVSITDVMGARAECSKRTRGEEVQLISPSGTKMYGNFYATGFKLARGGEDSSVLWCIWAREDGKWKILSYVLLTS